MLNIVKARPDLVIVTGHTDSTGPEVMNSGLSGQRAAEVAGFLQRAGIGIGRVVGAGEGSPIASNATAAGRRRSRRVEIQLCRLVEVPPPPIRA